MNKLFILMFLLTLASCAFVPSYRATKVEYCEKINGVIYCGDDRYDTNYYPGCSVYDDRSCEDRR